METIRRNADRLGLVAIIVALFAGATMFRIVRWGGLDQTAALFVGVPACFAVVVALMPRSTSITGILVRVVTIGLLLSGPILKEGFICIVMSAPLFYIVAIIAGKILDMSAAQLRQRRRNRMSGLAILPFLLFSLEGTNPVLSFSRGEEVTVQRVVPVEEEAIASAMAASPRFDRQLPRFLGIGFPVPREVQGEGLAPGDRRVIQFGNRAGRALTTEVAEVQPGSVRFRVVEDRSKIAEWLRFKEAEVRWWAVDDGAAQVQWTIRYERLLDPAWYFGPWERYAVGQAAEYLIDAVAIP